MVFWIMLSSMVIALIAIYFSASSFGTNSKNMIFGVTLPQNAVKDDRILQLQNQYKRQLNLFGLGSFASALAMFFIRESFTLTLTYFLIWIIAVIYAHHIPYRKANLKLASIKKENNWFVGEKKIISIDTKVSRLKNTMVIRAYWFTIPLAISLLMLMAARGEETAFLNVMAWTSLVSTVIFYGVYILFANMKTKVYSENSDINLAANRVYKRYWSMLWLFLAIYQAISSYLTYWLVSALQDATSYVVIILILSSSIPLIAILLVISKIKNTTKELIDLSGKEELITDEDDNWIYGIFYHNPNDKSILVEKRFGIGMTFNMATLTGKVFTYGSLVLILATFIPIILFAGYSDVVGHSLQIDEDREVHIKTMLYGHSFNLDEAEEITLIDTMPGSFRTNGVGTSSYLRGNFTVRDYGKSKMYIYNDNPPYIVIKLEDIYVFYNEKDPEETIALYDLLLDKIR